MQVKVHAGIALFGLFLVLSLLIRARTSSIENQMKELRVNKILTIAKQWIQSASLDSDPVIALMHASGGMAYLSSARVLMSDNEITKATSENIAALTEATQKNMSSALKRIRGKMVPHR